MTICIFVIFWVALDRECFLLTELNKGLKQNLDYIAVDSPAFNFSCMLAVWPNPNLKCKRIIAKTTSLVAAVFQRSSVVVHGANVVVLVKVADYVIQDGKKILIRLISCHQDDGKKQ